MTKIVSLSDEAYADLTALKRPGDSFSNVVERIAKDEKKKRIIEFCGKWPGNKEELDKIASELREERKGFKLR